MITPSRSDLLAYLGKNEVGQQEAAQIDVILNAAYLMVKAYTRGRGFGLASLMECEEDLAAVVVSSAARLQSNPTLFRQTSSGPFAFTPGLFNGWTLPELAILNTYRVRAR